MPRSVRRKSSTMDLSKLTRRQSTHPYNLRRRKRYLNYNEIHTGVSLSQRKHQPPVKMLDTSVQTDTRRRYHRNLNDVPCTSSNQERNRTTSRDRVIPETTTLYVNESFGRTAECSSNTVNEEEADAETEAESQSVNTVEEEENVVNLSDDAEFSDASYRRNYSASAYGYQELIGHSIGFQITRSASQSRVRNELDLGESIRGFDALATGDGGHNDPNILEFSVRILDNNENYRYFRI